MAPEGIYRVTARGRFNDLSEQAHAHLVRQQPDHDIFKSAYTTEGTFTYDEKIQFFNLRYEVRTSEGAEDAARIGEKEATLFLRTLGYSSHKLKITVANVPAMWEEQA
jgi:hypothetical protein